MIHPFFHELVWCGLSNLILLRMICCKCHNLDPYDHREFFWCVFSNAQLEKMLMCWSLYWLVEKVFSQISQLKFLDESISKIKILLWKFFLTKLIYQCLMIFRCLFCIPVVIMIVIILNIGKWAWAYIRNSPMNVMIF